ncbi:hypothetical protein Tco_1068406 [Tanacetum coccineum]|uniref:Uncharacterized protein n=1 Tax=Tanacetum coccineum TaxID=301880 RepID=A0ABQ5HGH1_9ASTR
MASTKAIIYAPQCGAVKSVQFKINNFMGEFSYPHSVLSYKNICKFLKNCSLALAFSKTPSIVYQNYLREFWCTAVVEDPNPPADESEVRHLKEFLIKFIVKNGQKTLTLDYKTICETTRLDYSNGQYVDNPSTNVVKVELAKIATNEALVQKTPVIKTSFHVAWRILLMAKSRKKDVSYPRFISCALEELLGSEYSQDKSFRFLPSILKREEVYVTQPKPMSQGLEASGALPQKRKKSKTQTTSLVHAGNKQLAVKGLPATHPDDGTSKTQPLPKGTNIDPKDSGRNTQLADRGQPKALVINLSGAGTKYPVDQTQSTRFKVSDPDHNKGKTSSEVESNTDTMILTTVADIQALLGDSEDELKDDSDEEMLEAGEELDEEFL